MNTIKKGDKMSEIKIKEFKYDNGWAEVTWTQYTTTTKEVEVDGEVKTEESVEEIVLHCESFGGHPEYIAMMEAKASEFGTSLDEYAELIEELASTYVAPTEAELAEAERIQKIQEATGYLANTEWVKDYKLRHDLGLEIIPEDSTKWEIIYKRAEYIAYLKGI